MVGLREAADVVLDLAPVAQELNVGTVHQDTTLLLQLNVLVPSQRSESPVLADDDLLATRELVHRSTESLDGSSSVRVSGSDGQKDLADVDTSDRAVGLTPGTSHSGLQSIGTSARQHLVDSDDMVRVGSNSQVKTFLSGNLDKVPRTALEMDVTKIEILNILVGANTGGFKGFGAQLFVFVRHHVHAKRELVDIGTLSSQIENTNLGVRYTTVESGFRVRLRTISKSDFLHAQ